MARDDNQDRICVAQIGAAHGIRGEVRLRAFTADAQALLRYGPLDSEDSRTIEIEALRPAKDAFVARLKGVRDRNAAEALRNLRLYVARDKLAPPAEDEFYLADLIGLDAVRIDGAPLGKIIAVPNYGAGDLLEIAPATGGASVLVPFTRRAVPQVDLAAGRVVLDPPEGTFDDGADAGQGASPPSTEGGLARLPHQEGSTSETSDVERGRSDREAIREGGNSQPSERTSTPLPNPPPQGGRERI